MEPVTQLEEEEFHHPIKDESDEISRKRFEKELLVKYQASISLLQERKISEGIARLHDLLTTEEINNLKIPNPDYAKLKAACHLNLYKAYSEIKQHRKSFYFMIKYLDYERDDYQMSYEFGSNLLSEGFLSGAIIYFKRALSFAIARTDPEFSELILDKLLMALCILDEPYKIRDLLSNLENQKIFKHIDLSKFWYRYYTHLKILNTDTQFRNIFTEEIEAYEIEHGAIAFTNIQKIRVMRQSIKAKDEALKTESSQMIIQQIIRKPETQIKIPATQKISSKLTLNSILGKIAKSLDTYPKPIRKDYDFTNSKKEKKAAKSDNNQSFFNKIQNEVFVFENEKKTPKECNGIDEKRKFTIIQKIFDNKLGTENDLTNEYLLGLLKNLAFDHPKFFVKDTHLTPDPLFLNSKQKTVFAIREKFYQNMISECNNKSILNTISTFIEINFSEKIREYRNNDRVIFFLGPSYFLLEDFSLNKKEIFSVFNFMFSFFKLSLEFESHLVFLECYLATAEPTDFKTILPTLKKQAQYLKQSFNQLDESFFIEKTNRFIIYLQLIVSSNNWLYRIFDVNWQVFGCENELCSKNFQNGENKGLCENCFRGLATEAHSTSPVFNWLLKKLKSDIQKRLDLIINILWFNDSQIPKLNKLANQEMFIKSNLTILPGYWCQQQTIDVTTQNFLQLFNNLAKSMSYNDLEFISMFVSFNFQELYIQLEATNAAWIYLSKLIAFLLELLGSQAVNDNKILENFFDLVIRIFQLSDAIKFSFREVKTKSLEKSVYDDKEFVLLIFKLIVVLFSCSNNTGNACLKFLVRFMLRIYWKLQDFENYIIFFQFINTFNEFSTVNQNLNDVLFTSSKRIRFLKSSLFLFQKYPEIESPNEARKKIVQLHLRMHLLEICRFIELVHGIKIPTTQLFNFFKSKLNKLNDTPELKGFLDLYKFPTLKVKMHILNLLSESLNKESSQFFAELLTEQFLVFKLYSELTNCLENFALFLFNSKDKDTGFGENKCFGDRSLRVHSTLDFKIINNHFSKIEKLLKNFENLGDLEKVFRKMIQSHCLMDGVFTVSHSEKQTFDAADIDFSKNTQMFVFLVLLVRFQESVHIDQPIKTGNDIKNFNYKMIYSFYEYLEMRNPFKHELLLNHFLEDARSRSAMISSFTNNEYGFPISNSSTEPEIYENKIIMALVNRQKIKTKIKLLEDCNRMFNNMVDDQLIYDQHSYFDAINKYLNSASDLINSKSTKRIDYLLVFYFPNQLIKLAIKTDDILKKIDCLCKSLALTNALETYHLNFKSGNDSKQPEKNNQIRIIALARVLNAKYRAFFNKKSGFDTDKSHHVKLADKLLFDLYKKHSSNAMDTELANNQVSLLKKNGNNNGGQQGIKSFFINMGDSKPCPSEHGSLNKDDSLVQIVSENADFHGAFTLPSNHNSGFYQDVKLFYEELFKLLENKPKSFVELWNLIFTLIYEFNPSNRKLVSSIFHYNMSEIVLSVRGIFKNRFAEDQYPLSFLEQFKKLDIIDREKDFKIYHCDSTLMKNFVFYSRLFNTLDRTSPNRFIFLISSIKLLKRFDAKSDNLFLGYLLFPIASEFESNNPVNIDLIRAIWDARIETAKLSQGSDIINILYKYVMKKCYFLVLQQVKENLPTEEDRQEIDTHVHFLMDQSMGIFDLETSIKKERNLKSNIKKYFEDKVAVSPTDQKVNRAHQAQLN